MAYLEILEQLNSGQIDFDQTLHRIERERSQSEQGNRKLTEQATGRPAHKRWFSCLTIQIREKRKRRLTFKIPLFVGSAAIGLAGCSGKVRRALKEQDLSVTELRHLFRQLKSSDLLFLIEVHDHDGSEICIRNASRHKASQA